MNEFTSNDPAFSVMTLDILSKVLSHADDPGRVATYLTEDLRELTGARCVLFVQCRGAKTDHALRVLSVNPLRRREWAESEDARRLYKIVHDMAEAHVWRWADTSEVAELLHREGFDLSLTVPLNVGSARVGALLVLGLADETHLDSEIQLLTTLSGVLALVLKNALLFEGQEQAIRDRTRDLESALLALQQSEDIFKYVFESANVGKAITLPTGEIKVNAAFAELLGYRREELDNYVWQDLTPPEDVEGIQQLLAPLLAGEKEAVRFNKVYVHKNGTHIWADVSVKMRRDTDGRPLHYIVTIVDITERKKAEEEISRLNAELEQRVMERTLELETANKELEAFSYSISHDLRAPLRAVDSFINILMEDYSPFLDNEGRRICAVISTAARNMGRLIDNLLGFAKVGRTSLQLTSIDMEALATSVFHDLTTPGERERISFRVDALPRATGDPALIRQVWANLLDNALKFTARTGNREINISAAREGDDVAYVVRDNGAGFDMRFVDKLFGVFQRLHGTKDFEGTGAGLAIVHRIILRHGGRVWAEGEVGKGASFFFTLPADIPKS